MFEQVLQIRMLLAQVDHNMRAMYHENEQLRKEYDRLSKENQELKKKLDNKETT